MGVLLFNFSDSLIDRNPSKGKEMFIGSVIERFSEEKAIREIINKSIEGSKIET
tara:strand:+ start:1892 stop:2053 length:162 start_codon:yes stop_codon:yes gene_type:complete